MPDPILPRVARREPGAAEALLERFGGLVWSIAQRLAPTRADAEDAVQDVFLELWRVAERWDPRVGAEATFVATIARRRLIDRIRRLGVRPAHDLPASLATSSSHVVRRVSLADEASRAARALRELRPEQQQVLELAIFQGLTHPQISERTGLPLGTVKTHARRGLIRLRELLDAPPAGAAPVDPPDARGPTS